ncbi:MAG: ParB/RepB/Spo0J family partition protein [Ignavibacteriales bacterium]|jgi:ParB family chromosome partitioning protein|nr:ParB/RepB/Spo0J family partition protein [Ignavibacteriales bacterium]MBK8660712.1 ParB/RepB/Spo0J family partition protein [Ignavibacteriales bacterium]MBP7542652.1 ParB/RepB/Spo0J family partition protein [Ignavibacteriaceae bacterium]MBP9123055.1 ParB/RepB/Spo0J family partition protein [Ignavibacteriaceae bacterium]MCC6637606.1 ParB/RepB/Spo0J family partition protein [Ignavibacteriaceae bacterium]
MAKVKSGLGRGLEALMGTMNESDFENNEESSSSQPVSDSIKKLSVMQIKPNPFQPRTNFDREALEDLKRSILTNGLIQPVTVRKVAENSYELISGERRLRAFRELGYPEIPAYIMIVSSDEVMLAMALIENIQREKLDPIEEATAYKRLMEECDLTQEEIADRVGKNRSTIANSIRLLKLPDRIKDALIRDEITVGHARALINLPDEITQIHAFQRMIDEGMSVRKVEELVKALTRPAKIKPVRVVEKPKPKSSSALNSIEDYLRKIFATKVICSQKHEGTGEIVIQFFSNEELDRLVELFEIIEKNHN